MGLTKGIDCRRISRRYSSHAISGVVLPIANFYLEGKNQSLSNTIINADLFDA